MSHGCVTIHTSHTWYHFSMFYFQAGLVKEHRDWHTQAAISIYNTHAATNTDLSKKQASSHCPLVLFPPLYNYSVHGFSNSCSLTHLQCGYMSSLHHLGLDDIMLKYDGVHYAKVTHTQITGAALHFYNARRCLLFFIKVSQNDTSFKSMLCVVAGNVVLICCLKCY